MVKDLFWQVLYHLQSVEPAFARGRMRSGYLRRFFKELKQTVQLVDFVGYNQNAVQWQICFAFVIVFRSFLELNLHASSASLDGRQTAR
jgi:hypothetical protein